MGQCSSTLPATTTTTQETTVYDRDNALVETQPHKKTLRATTNTTNSHHMHMDVVSSPQENSSSKNTPRKLSKQPPPIVTPNEPQSREPNTTPSLQAMDVEPRDPPVPLPDHAVRTRCYKLNLDASDALFNAAVAKPIFLGPFSETLPTFSGETMDDDLDDDDEDLDKDHHEMAVAIQTAQIFRGITVAPDGTILSQNARATRSNRSSAGGAGKTKLSEKSRQAAKIDKANDLIEQDGTGEKLVSLVVIGEYDDMKYLVRDGSRKLREADGLPDEALLQVNRPRVSRRPLPSTPPPVVSSASSSRRRRAAVETKTTSSLPKLKSNPRDTASQRRKDSLSGLRAMRLDSCHDFMDSSSRVQTNDDWTHAWNIWNCGAAAAPPASPESRHEAPVYPSNHQYSSRRVS